MTGRQLQIPMPHGWHCLVDERAERHGERATAGLDAEFRMRGIVVTVRMPLTQTRSPGEVRTAVGDALALAQHLLTAHAELNSRSNP